jgi:hypothetical protein
MANADRPSGLTPIGTLSGADYHGKMRRVGFAVGDSVACFIGDLVKLTGTVDATGKYPIVAQCAAGDPAIGVLVSLDPDFTNEGTLKTNHRLASTARTGRVVFGQDVLYAIQEDSDGNAIEITEAGFNCDVIVGSGNALSGISGMELDSTSAANTSGLNVRLHHVYDSPDNVLGTNARWVVSINDSQEDLNQTGV